MSLLAISVAALAACAILAIVFSFANLTRTKALQPPPNLYVAPIAEEPRRVWTGASWREALHSATGIFNPLLERSSQTNNLERDLQAAGLPLRPSEWVLALLGAGLILGLILWARFDLPYLVILGFVITWLLGKLTLNQLRKRRGQIMERQLGNTIVLLSNALKSGYSFPQALNAVTKSSSQPILGEYMRTAREIELGTPIEDALQHMMERNNSEDMDLLATTVQIQRTTGGSLAEIFDNIAFTIRERARIQAEIRTISAQARLSGWIITLLPIVLAAALIFIAPDYFSPMLTKTAGRVMLVISAVSMAAGFVLIRRIIDIEV